MPERRPSRRSQRTDFAPFAQRLTRSYALLAVALILLVVATTSALAFVLYVGTLNEAAGVFAQRAAQRAENFHAQGLSLRSYAPSLVEKTGRTRIHILVYDDRHTLVAGSPLPRPSRLASAAAALLGLHPAVVRVSGGAIVAAADVAGFAGLLARYLAIVLPIGALAVLAAWLLGRRISARAIAPLADVTQALRRIAAGDFTPEALLAASTDLVALTKAYNDAARRLGIVTAQRERDEQQMRQFVADAGHELRTPLTVVMGYLDVLSQGVVTDSQGIARVHATMLAESRRMRGTIDKLMLLARLERPSAPQRVRLDVRQIVERVAQALEPIAGKGRIAVRSPQAHVEADEAELFEAVKNVVENAVRYAPESPVTIDVSNEGSCVTIVVSDRGQGMEPHDAEHAFDRFFRGSDRAGTEGSGLGLAIAKRAIERAGGSIELSSARGEGTRVRMQLAAAP